MIEYGDTLIETLKTEYEGKPGVQIDDDGEVETESDLIIPFAKLTVGVERYEVARRFAAVLQLVIYYIFILIIILFSFYWFWTNVFLQVNNENVKVITDHEIDSLGFHLLSVKPKYDIENYRAPSLNPFTTAASSSSASSSSQPKKNDLENGKKKAKRGRPSKDEKANKKDGKGKKPAESEEEVEEEEEEHEEVKEGEEETETGKGKGKTKAKKHDNKENLVNGKEKRKRKERTFYEPEEEVLKGPRTKMFEVAV